MLVTFSSKADMDVLMMEKHAIQVLIAAGKLTAPEIPQRGVFTIEQLDDAIKNLQVAIHEEGTTLEKHPDDQDEDDDDNKPKAGEVVLLAQRAAPLLQMMRKAKAAHAPILWETSSGY